jgi:hypothetical protein
LIPRRGEASAGIFYLITIALLFCFNFVVFMLMGKKIYLVYVKKMTTRGEDDLKGAGSGVIVTRYFTPHQKKKKKKNTAYYCNTLSGYST